MNNYFEKFTIVDSFPRGTFPVYYEDSLFELDVYQIKTTHTMQGSLSGYVDSVSYIDYLSLHIRVWNTYPTDGKVQVYFRNASEFIVNSLFDAPKNIDNGKPNPEGKVVQPNKPYRFFIPLTFSHAFLAMQGSSRIVDFNFLEKNLHDLDFMDFQLHTDLFSPG